MSEQMKLYIDLKQFYDFEEICDIVYIGTKFRTSMIWKMYKEEASKLHNELKEQRRAL